MESAEGDIGKIPQEGDIVDIPYGIRVIRERPKKSWLTAWADKRKKYKEEGTIVAVHTRESTEGDDLGDYGDFGNDDDDDGIGGGDDGDGDDVDLEGEDEEDEDTPGPDAPVIGGGRSKPKFEIQDEWKYMKVPIFTTSAAEALAISMGLPTHHEKLVRVSIRRAVENVHIVHTGTYRMRVGPRGKLLPLENEKRTVAAFDENDPDHISRITKTPPAFEPKPRLLEKNPYSDEYDFGAYVKFVKDGIDMEGIVMSYTEYSVGVAVKEGLTSEIIFVDYDDVSLKKALPPAKILRSLKSMITVEQVYTGPVPDEIRKTIVDTYLSILNRLRIGTGPGMVPPVTPSSTGQNLKTVLLGPKPMAPSSWNDYYSGEFFKWIKNKHHELFKGQVDTQKVTRVAAAAVKNDSDASILLQEITSELPGGELKYDTTVDDILNVFTKVKNITVFQATCIQALEKAKYSGRGEESGIELADILSTTIEAYYRMHPPHIDTYYQYVFNLELDEKRESYIPTDLDRAEFEGTYLETLQKLHDQAIDKYGVEKEKYNESIREAERIKKDLPASRGGTEPPQSPFRNDNKRQVERFEQIIFASFGSSVHSYLTKVLVPHIFLEGKLASHAHFFRAKVANGSFPFSALVGANVAHYLPEFAMNKSLTDGQWEAAGYAIGAILHNDVATIVDTYVNILNPTSQVQHSGLAYSNIINMVDGLEKMLVDPISLCDADTNTGYRPVISSDNRYSLDPRTRELLEERIPDGDLAICYDPTTKNFTCHSTRDVMLAIVKGDLTNPHTKRPYPSDFVERIQRRNASIISGLKLPGSPEPLPEPVIPVKKISPPKPPPKKQEKPPRKRHVPPKDAEFEAITNILLLGEIEEIALFGYSIYFNVRDEDSGEVVEQEIPVTYNAKDKGIDVAVLTYHVDDPVASMENLKTQIKSVPSRVNKIYVAGLGLKIPKDKIILSAKIKKELPRVKKIFWAESENADEMRDILIDVAIDVEGLVVVD